MKKIIFPILLLKMFFCVSCLQSKDLRGKDFRRKSLAGKNLMGAWLQRALLQNAYMYRAYLMYAKLNDAHLEGANLQEANLFKADISGANLEGADLTGANLKNIIVGPYTNLNGVKGIPEAELARLNQIIAEKTASFEEEERRQREFIDRSLDNFIAALVYIPKHVVMKILNRFYSTQES